MAKNVFKKGLWQIVQSVSFGIVEQMIGRKLHLSALPYTLAETIQAKARVAVELSIKNVRALAGNDVPQTVVKEVVARLLKEWLMLLQGDCMQWSLNIDTANSPF